MAADHEGHSERPGAGFWRRHYWLLTVVALIAVAVAIALIVIYSGGGGSGGGGGY